MRFVAIGIVTLLAVAPASAQVPLATPHPYGLDPYAPSDAFWLRTYGAALVAQTPMLELATLDPYKPSDAALLRQIGGAMPLCCLDWYWPGLALGPSTPLSLRSVTTMATPPAAAATPSAAPVAAAPSQPGPTSAATVARPANNDGISIRYGGQIWTSAGRAVPRQESTFERVGEYSGFSVYKQAGVNDGVIYVPARNDRMAPYRLKP